MVHGLAPRWRRPSRPDWRPPIRSRSRWPTASSPVRRRPGGRGAARTTAREAQARCPQLHVTTADPAAEARHFEAVTSAVDEVVPRAEVLRPGQLVVVGARAARYFGSAQAVAERLVDAAVARGRGRMPDGRRRSVGHRGVRGQGRAHRGTRTGCGLPVRAVHPAAGRRTQPRGPGREELADLLWGWESEPSASSPNCPRTDVSSRFGADAINRTASPAGRPTGVRRAGAAPGPRCGLSLRPAPSTGWMLRLRRARAGRGTAPQSGGRRGRLHRLSIQAVTANGEELNRVWRCAEPLNRGCHRRPGALAVGRLAVPACG